MFGYVYKITILDESSKFNNCYYIGQHISTNIQDGYYGSGVLIKNYIKKHGVCNLKKEILYICNSIEELNSREYESINTLFEDDTVYRNGKCLNLKEGGKNAKASLVSKNKMSINTSGEKNGFYGKHHSIETKQKLSEKSLGKNNAMYGKTHSNEVKEKLRQFRTGKKHYPETIALFKKMRCGLKWYTNGIIEKFCKECPEGFYPGRKK